MVARLDSADHYRPVGATSIRSSPIWPKIPADFRAALDVVGSVLPFRTNNYVLEKLIDWDRVPDDPVFRLNFLHPEMLEPTDYQTLRNALQVGTSRGRDAEIQRIRNRLNPHPGRQTTKNVPIWEGRPLPGIQHKYRETVLLFPEAAQTCHAYCTFCFRWPQFVGSRSIKISAPDSADLVRYLQAHRDVTDVLLTGGDPLIMKTSVLRKFVEPLLSPELESIKSIRIGTKSVGYWPRRFFGDRDSSELLRLFERIVRSSRHLALMIHCSHPIELATPEAETALARIRDTGATMRLQAPIIRHVNDCHQVWTELWAKAVHQGIIPYYMFIERDTGPRRYFQLPLVRAWEIFRRAYQQVSGLARSVRGPVMSTDLGKVLIDGVVDIRGERLFALQFLQARSPDWVRRPFFTEFSPDAVWFDELVPLQEESFFFKSTPDIDRPPCQSEPNNVAE
jgi:L-lysine 2,3-aminomutase